MIRPSEITSAKDAARYYSDVARAAEYYQGEGIPNQWLGRGSEQFGLNGPVSQGSLEALLEGHVNGQHLGRQARDGTIEHRKGWDFTISAPKSVSTAALVFGRDDVLEAHRQAATTAMAYLEERVRSRINGQFVQTGNLAMAQYEHVTSRKGDPQLHWHVLVANATMHEGKVYSIDSKSLFTVYRTADAIYHQELSRRLQSADYNVRHDKHGRVEIADYSRDQLREFSKRSQEIEAVLAEHGMTRKMARAWQREEIALNTRVAKKSYIETREANVDRWNKQAALAGVKAPLRNVDPFSTNRGVDEVKAAGATVAGAIAHLSERDMVFTERKFHQAIASFNRGQAGWSTIDLVIRDLEERGELIRKGDEFTTKTSVAAERALELRVSAGRGQHRVVMNDQEFNEALALFERRKGFELSMEQRTAAHMILTEDDRYQGVQGLAGTGKTTMLEFVRESAEIKGWVVHGMSNGAEQAAKLQSESGIRSVTTARHLLGKRQDGAKTGQPNDTVLQDARLAREARDTWVLERERFIPRRVDWVTLVQNGVVTHDADGNRYARMDDGRVFAENLVNPKRDTQIGSSHPSYELEVARQKELARLTDMASHEHERGRKELWIHDEASMSGLKEFRELTAAAEKSDARVVSLGDERQHQSVEAGKTFERLQNHMPTAELGRASIRRQVEGSAAHAAVQATLDGKQREALQAIEKVEVRDAQDKLKRKEPDASKEQMRDAAKIDNRAVTKQIARDYANLSPADRKETIVITSTNTDRKAINAEMREALRERGAIGEADHQITTLKKVDLTQEQRGQALQFLADDPKREPYIVQARETNRGSHIKAGQQFEVIAANERTNTLTLRSLENHQDIKKVDPKVVPLEAYQRETRGLSDGDTIRFTENHRIATLNGGQVKVTNGQFAEVTKVGDGRAKLVIHDVSGKGERRHVTMSTDRPLKIDHAATYTSYKSQGHGKGRAWIHHNTEAGAHGNREWYVNITRAKQDARIYTQDADKALKQVGVARSKESAVEFSEQTNQSDRYAVTRIQAKPDPFSTPLERSSSAPQQSDSLSAQGQRNRNIGNSQDHVGKEGSSVPQRKRDGRGPSLSR